MNNRPDEVSDISLSENSDNVIIDSKMKVLLYALREALLIMVAAIEVFLGLPRTKPPTHR
jgi:hypothetical protein